MDIFGLIKSELTPDEWGLLGGDLDARNSLGWKTYGQPMRPNDGRNTIRDSYEELLDAVAYLRKDMAETGRDDRLFRRAVALAADLKVLLDGR